MPAFIIIPIQIVLAYVAAKVVASVGDVIIDTTSLGYRATKAKLTIAIEGMETAANEAKASSAGFRGEDMSEAA